MAKEKTFVNKQVSSFKTSTKDGAIKVLGIVGSFTGTPNKGGKLEPSPLYRLVVDAHYVKGKEKLRLEGNIPIVQLPSMLELSKKAMVNDATNGNLPAFAVLSEQWKPKVTTKDDKGNPLVYNISVQYIPGRTYGIQVTVSNAYCPVTKYPDGRMTTKVSQRYKPDGTAGEDSITFNIASDVWYNELEHIYATYLTFKNRMANLGHYDDAFGIRTE